HILVGEAVSSEVAVLVVLDQHVGGPGELARDRLSLRHGDIQRHRFLAAVGRAEVRRVARGAAVAVLDPTWTEGARSVAVHRALKLDDLGAEVGEVLARPRTGEHARKVENADMRKRTGHGLRSNGK